MGACDQRNLSSAAGDKNRAVFDQKGESEAVTNVGTTQPAEQNTDAMHKPLRRQKNEKPHNGERKMDWLGPERGENGNVLFCEACRQFPAVGKEKVKTNLCGTNCVDFPI